MNKAGLSKTLRSTLFVTMLGVCTTTHGAEFKCFVKTVTDKPGLVLLEVPDLDTARQLAPDARALTQHSAPEAVKEVIECTEKNLSFSKYRARRLERDTPR